MHIMKIFCGLFSIVLLLTGCAKDKTEETVKREPAHMQSFARLRELFKNPPVEYRSAPLWVWNDELTGEEIDRQLDELKDAGIGGGFIHPRPGLITPYLSDEWHSLCRYTVDRAREMGMQVWLYDENSYPSGFAGGHVPAEMPESYNQGQGLILHRAEKLPESDEREIVLILEKNQAGFVDITGMTDQKKGDAGDYYLFEKAYYRKSPWYGGYSYVDLLLEGVTEKFIEVTMEGYEQAIGDEFGKLVPGIFTDEPNIAPPARNCIRWTPALFSGFRERWGYDLETNLPSLFEEVGDWKRVRHNYYAILLEMFIERWSKPWYYYCEGKNLLWTGHYWEHGWPSPHHGGDNMAMYAWHHIPAIDILMNEYKEHVNAQFGNVRAVKELISVANQMGRTRTLSETYGAGGWDLRFEDMKRIGDWEYVLGVNFMNQHLSYVTIKGARKRDHPQSFSYHEPWWKFYRTVNEYFNRLSLMLSSGEQVNKILVIEPTSSAWMYYSPSNANPRVGEIGVSFQDFVEELEKYQSEYDLGCENIIRDNGQTAGGKLIVGKRSYDLVIFPPGLDNLDLSTAELLDRYFDGGGKVLSFVDAPGFVDGLESDRIQSLVKQRPGQWIRAESVTDPEALEMLLADDFRVINPENVQGRLFHHRRLLDDGELVFLVNTSLEENTAGSFTMNGKSVLKLDPASGEISSFPSVGNNGRVKVAFDLYPAGSLLLFVGGAPSPGSVIEAGPMSEKKIAPSGDIAVKRISPNTLTLDYCDLILDDTETKDVYFFSAADKIFRHHGLNGNPWSRAVQYRTNILEKDTFTPQSGFVAGFPFRVSPGADKSSLRAVVERPGLWRVSINGTTVEPLPGEWRLDRSFGVFDIGGYVIDGMNYITLTAVPMTIHSELEPVYIMGDFGLKAAGKGWRMEQSSTLTAGAWKEMGMPFYSDGVAYTGTYSLSPGAKHYKIKLGEWLGSVAEVRVNGRDAGIIGWQPYETDITALVEDGENEITVVVYGTLKNIFGPHHNNPPRGRAWPHMFQVAPEHQPPGEKYDFIGYGLFEDFSVVEYE